MTDTTILTDDDQKAIRMDLADKFSWMTPDSVDREVRKIARKVDEFTKRSELVRWSLQVLCALTEWTLATSNFRGVGTMEDLREAYEKIVSQGWEDHLDLLEVDAEYREYHQGTEDNHPWGDSIVDNGRRWLQATPYQVWVLADRVEDWTVAAALDECLDMAAEESNGGSVVEAAKEQFQREITRLLLRYKAEREGGVMGTEIYRCECDSPERQRYLVTHHDGTTELADYCDDCAELASIDWNGTTARISKVTT